MWIKICGVTTTADAAMIADADANAIGLNFYRQSKRYVELPVAKQISDSVRNKLDVVGVFVNSPAEEVAEIAKQTELAAVQFHGDESTEDILAFHNLLPNCKIIRAYRVGTEGTGPAEAQIQCLQQAGVPLTAVLVDAMVAGEYGGTGHQIDPNLLQARPSTWPQLVLAGGLTPESVAAAINTVHPWGVDTASGVETSPGNKCPDKVRAFISAIRSFPGPSNTQL